ncbi:TolC family protein [Azohydromonas lata]|uniref:TolC family protein n=2 Tax=Azohydromonas lata TaxID=45677 RepID=A0ABU5IL77_9BURK|nr:TolC family protein [Azohydromonas lata]MDZ5459650.1 TolC family protein [Azohydromonas lata]
MFASSKFALSSGLVAAMLLSGCASLVPQPLTPAEITATGAADRAAMQRDVEPLQGMLTLEEALARAVQYNLDRRTRMLDEALAQGQLEAGQYDMLPRLMANAGYRHRDEELITRSRNFKTGVLSPSDPFVSTARSAWSTDLSFTWSLLDFGQSYYATKQNADRVLIAKERKRKALHILMQDVRTAFWRAASAQKLAAEVRATLSQAAEALDDSRKAEAERLRNPLDALRYQRQLLENVRLLEAIDQELSTARIELASLVNLPLARDIRVAEPTQPLSRRWLDTPVEQMEELAIARNADLRESFYNARIAADETRRAMLKLFPGLSFSWGPHHSTDEYLINQTWRETGLQLSFNLLGVLSAPAQMRMADAGVAVANHRRMAMQMAVLTQVYVARQQYANALAQFERSDTIWKVDADIASHVARREQAQTQTKLDRVSNQTAAILSQLRRYQALAQAHAAAGRLQASLGMEPALEQGPQVSLAQMTQSVSTSLKQWDEAELTALPSLEPAALDSAPAAK